MMRQTMLVFRRFSSFLVPLGSTRRASLNDNNNNNNSPAMTVSKTKVQLVPWDPDSEDHVKRMGDQRVECGWDAEKVPKWREQQRTGFKCIYWIAFTPDDPSIELKLSKHLSIFPKERDAIKDTAPSIRATPRTPTGSSFHPVGHISLDIDNPPAKRLNLPIPAQDVYWIKSLYVSHALRSLGLGRAAMDAVEAMAVHEPLNAKLLMLDTVAEADQHQKRFKDQIYAPLPPMSTEAWYARRGYKVIWIEKDFYANQELGEKPSGRRVVFMRKDVV